MAQTQHPALVPQTRWTPSRKAAVVLAIFRGEITDGQAHRAHGLTPDELGNWKLRHRRHGQVGLAILKFQELVL